MIVLTFALRVKSPSTLHHQSKEKSQTHTHTHTDTLTHTHTLGSQTEEKCLHNHYTLVENDVAACCVCVNRKHFCKTYLCFVNFWGRLSFVYPVIC